MMDDKENVLVDERYKSIFIHKAKYIRVHIILFTTWYQVPCTCYRQSIASAGKATYYQVPVLVNTFTLRK